MVPGRGDGTSADVDGDKTFTGGALRVEQPMAEGSDTRLPAGRAGGRAGESRSTSKHRGSLTVITGQRGSLDLVDTDPDPSAKAPGDRDAVEWSLKRGCLLIDFIYIYLLFRSYDYSILLKACQIVLSYFIEHGTMFAT